MPRKSPVKVITSTAPAAAPEDSPNKKGSAKSFRVAVCKRTPTIANPPPTIEARIIRGNRKSIMILVIGLLAGSNEKNAPKSLPSSTETIVLAGISRPPEATPSGNISPSMIAAATHTTDNGNLRIIT